MQTVRATGGYSYRPGFGSVSVVDVSPKGTATEHKVLYGCPRLLAAGETVEVIVTEFGHLVYKPPVKVEVRKRPSYVIRKRR